MYIISTLRRLLPFWLVTTIVAAIQAGSVFAATVSEDVPVPGGREALASALDIDPIPDRARFISEVARLLHGSGARPPIDFSTLARELGGEGTAAGAVERIPVPLDAALWSDAVFRRRVAPGDLVLAILADRAAALVCYGLTALDDETLEYLAEHPEIVTQLYAFAAEPFAAFSSTLRVRDGRIAPPGGDEAVPLWEAVVGQSATRPDRFMSALFTQGEGRLAGLYDTIGHLDAPRQRFALSLWMDDPSARRAGMQALAAAALSTSVDWRTLRTQPFLRQPYDIAAALMRTSVDANGRPTPPAARDFWSRVMEGAELPGPGDEALARANDADAVDAAWVARLAASTDIRVRAEQLDQFAFGQRVFRAAAPGQRSDVFAATRAFRRYRMLMLTLERMDLRDPAIYVRAARLASRLSPSDPALAFVAQAQFQGALALLWRMRSVGTLDVPQTEALVRSLVAVPVSNDGQYLGGLLRWLSEDLRRAMPAAPTLEAAIIAALSGPDAAATAPRFDWEGQRYRVDLPAAERRRLERIREKQAGATLDLALELASAASQLTSSPSAPGAAQSLLTQISSVADRLPADIGRNGLIDTDSFPPGVVPPPSPRESLVAGFDELRRIAGGAGSSRLPRAFAGLIAAAERSAAQALVALVYAMELGDPDGPALLPADVSRRHDFGLGQRDNEQRLRAVWMQPRQDVSPGVPWHIDGSLLGLDVALASVGLRRLSTDRMLRAPALTSNTREMFAVGRSLMNPLELTDAGRDAIAAAIEAGRRRVALVRDAAAAGRIADELALDGWRRRALRWTAQHEPGRLESMLSLAELVMLGRGSGDVDISGWGTAATATTGCLCTSMPPPGRLPLLTGRRQIGLLAVAVPDLNLHVARTLSHLHLPASLAKYVLSIAVLDFIDEVRATDADDWLSLVRAAASVPLERIEDYVAAAAADGPLIPDSAQ